MSRIVLEGVSKRFGDTFAVDNLDLEIAAGEFFCLLGPSGCGKTTTMRCITGLERPEQGRIWIGDRLVFDGGDLSFVPTTRRRVGMVFQNYALWPHMTVRDNALFGLRVRRVPRAEQDRRLAETLELLQIPDLAGRYPGELSGGQQQRVALARELVAGAEVLVMDEPLSNLDAQLRVDMRFELKRLHEETGRTFIYITHDQIEALTLSSRMAVMRDGQVRQIGTPAEVYRAPQELFVATFIGSGSVGINLLPLTAAGRVLRGDGFSIPAPVGEIREGRFTLALRPEELQVSEVEVPDLPSLPCTVISEMPMGHVSLVHAALRTESGESGQIVKILHDGRTPLVRGAQIRVNLQPSSIHLFDAETGQRVPS